MPEKSSLLPAGLYSCLFGDLAGQAASRVQTRKADHLHPRWPEAPGFRGDRVSSGGPVASADEFFLV